MVSSPQRPRPFVVKVGGSVAQGGTLSAWLDMLKQFAATVPNRCVIVPGGGAFANKVREVQKELKFDDHAAHHMALLAMEQFGLALASLWPGLTLAATPAAIRRAWRMQKIPWWAPTHMTLAASAPARSWEMTSDSLAAWLAGEIKAERIVLIKSIDLESEPEPLCSDLVANGIVDPLFGHFAATSGAEVFLAGPATLRQADAIRQGGGTFGTRIRSV